MAGGRQQCRPFYSDAINHKGVMKLSDRKIDLQKREEGAWVKDIPEFGDLELKVRGQGNKAWARMEQKLIAAVPRQRRANGLDPEDLLRINATLVHKCSLLDWRNMENGDGTEEPYSEEAAKKYLYDPQYELFVGACIYAARVVAEQNQVEIEDDAKN